MTDDTPTSTGQPTVQDSLGPADIPAAQASGAASGSSGQPSAAAGGSSVSDRAAAIANERPEVAAGAAFGGGLLLALILKRLAR